MARIYTGGAGVSPEPITGSRCVRFLSDCENEENFIPCSANMVFSNSLIVALICSFTTSVTDLLNFRQVNHVFQQEATKRFKAVHKHVCLKTEIDFQEFLRCMKNREFLQLTPFPFSAFRVNMYYNYCQLNLETLETFGSLIGPHINRYSFWVVEVSRHEPNWVIETGSQIAILLSHSPLLIQLELNSNSELCLTDSALQRLPTYFPHLRNIKISGFNLGNIPEMRYPLTDLLVERAPRLEIFKIPEQNRTQSLRILRSLVQTRPNNLPLFRLGSRSSSTDIWFLQELIKLNVRFTEIAFLIEGWYGNGVWMERTMYDWLETQSSTLTVLRLKLDKEIRSFPLPSLPVLTTLTIKFPEFYDGWLAFIDLPIGNPFPVLKKLCLENYCGHMEMFELCPIPSLEELHLRFFPVVSR